MDIENYKRRLEDAVGVCQKHGMVYMPAVFQASVDVVSEDTVSKISDAVGFDITEKVSADEFMRFMEMSRDTADGSFAQAFLALAYEECIQNPKAIKEVVDLP